MVKRIFVILIFVLTLFGTVQAQTTERVYLSGKGKDDAVIWDFYITKGMNSGKWSKLPVPSCWEPHGFGIYTYGWGDSRVKADERGIYKHTFNVPENYKGKLVNIVFDGVMTEAIVFINGKKAGEKHIGGYYRFKYDISKLVKYGQTNTIRVEVDKVSENKSMNVTERQGDFWTVTGIHRPVYLEISNKEHIRVLAVNAKENGDLFVDVKANLKNASYKIEQELIDLKTGKQFGETKEFIVNGKLEKQHIESKYKGVKVWNTENPNLYVLRLTLKKNNTVLHQFEERIGFRTVEVRPQDGIYVNGTRIVFKGVNYHSWHPEWGRTTSKELSISDALLMKEMNMNAVRMAHYPHDDHFYQVCDSLGLMVFDELANYHAPYDYELGKKLLGEMMETNVNHPSIVAFANGNEGGFDLRLESIFKALDPQKRFVYHPTHYHNGMDAQHYKSFDYAINTFHHSRDVFVQTEFLHALYDGGAGAGLDDFWQQMKTTQNSAGGFIWAFLDEGIVRRDLNDSIDCAGASAPDGIVGPYREKEASFYTIRDVWSPIQIKMNYIPKSFTGKLKVDNDYLYTNLKECSYKWQLKTFGLPTIDGTVTASGKGKFPSIAAGLSGYIQVDLPDFSKSDVLELMVFDKNGGKLNTWTWPIATPKDISEKIIVNNTKETLVISKTTDLWTVNVAGMSYQFDKGDALLKKVIKDGEEIPLKNGPIFTYKDIKVSKVTQEKVGENIEIRASLKGDSHYKWTITPAGLLKFSYRLYNVRGKFDYFGVSWNYPETTDLSVKALGRGPYRAWNNRLRGQHLGVWEKTYNNTSTGVTWDYPEFKGYHSDVYWAEISNSKYTIKIINETENTFLRLFTPIMNESRNTVLPPFPEGNISLMSAIPPIGSKINKPDVLGHQGLQHHLNLHGQQKPLEGDYWFEFNKNKE